ncbi:hypothetical protein Pelo_1248 [Pelomyxa schiedti]|nr:hypothetical protein Pelo_1248 [Pelomyxa schiedti]
MQIQVHRGSRLSSMMCPDRLITVIEASRAPVESDFDDPDDVELPYPSSTLEITDRDLANIPTVSQLLWSEGNAPVDDVGFWSRAPTAQLLATTLTHLSNAAAKS